MEKSFVDYLFFHNFYQILHFISKEKMGKKTLSEAINIRNNLVVPCCFMLSRKKIFFQLTCLSINILQIKFKKMESSVPKMSNRIFNQSQNTFYIFKCSLHKPAHFHKYHSVSSIFFVKKWCTGKDLTISRETDLEWK